MTKKSVRRGVPAVHQDRRYYRLHRPDDGGGDPPLLRLRRGSVLLRSRGAGGRGRRWAATGFCFLEALALIEGDSCCMYALLLLATVVEMTAWVVRCCRVRGSSGGVLMGGVIDE